MMATLRMISMLRSCRPRSTSRRAQRKRTVFSQLKKVSLTDYKERILRVLIYLQNHLDEALSLEELARVACFFLCRSKRY